MEMTELQRSLSEAHGEASGARETADQVMTSLQEAQAIHKQVCIWCWHAVDTYPCGLHISVTTTGQWYDQLWLHVGYPGTK